MDSLTLTRILARSIPPDRCAVAGVFPRDWLDVPTTTYPACCIANTDDSTKPGKHWVAYYFNTPTDYEFFDSYGYEPSKYNFPLSNPNVSNLTSVQSDSSNCCGHFCLYYLHCKIRGLSMDVIIHSFSRVDLHWNDKLVRKYASLLNNSYATLLSPHIPSPATQISLIKRVAKLYYY